MTSADPTNRRSAGRRSDRYDFDVSEEPFEAADSDTSPDAVSRRTQSFRAWLKTGAGADSQQTPTGVAVTDDDTKRREERRSREFEAVLRLAESYPRLPKPPLTLDFRDTVKR